MCQQLELSTWEKRFGVPEQSILSNEFCTQVGLETVEFAPQLAVGVYGCSKLGSRFFKLVVDLLKLGLTLATCPLNLGL